MRSSGSGASAAAGRGPVPTPRAPSPATSQLADEEVVQRVTAGDRGLFEVLMRRYNQRLFRIARSILGNDAGAEDVMQEAYVRAFENLHRFAGRARFSTWLTKIAVHEALARRRQGRRLVGLAAVEDLDGELVAESGGKPLSPEADSARGELRETLRRAVEALPPNLRVVFVMREVEQLSTAETAEALGLGESVVKVRLHRARRALRDDLERRIGGAAGELYASYAPRCDRVVAAVLDRIGA